MSLLIDSRSSASLPGGLKLNPIRYCQYFPFWPAAFCVAAIGGGILAFWHWVGLLILVPALLAQFVFWRHQAARFASGCANPAQVVSDKPFLLAVYTDLTTGDKPYPVIKIVPHPKKSSTPLEERCATVSLYRGSGDAEHWEDFEPKLAECATSDEEQVRTLLSRIPEEEWSALAEGLVQVPRPWKNGIYPIKRRQAGASH
jgi:hypothetical protein